MCFFSLLFPIRIKNSLKLFSTCWLTQTTTTSTPPETPRRCCRAPSYASSTAKSPPSCVRTNNPKAPPTPSDHLTATRRDLTHTHTASHLMTSHYADFKRFTYLLISAGKHRTCSLLKCVV